MHVTLSSSRKGKMNKSHHSDEIHPEEERHQEMLHCKTAMSQAVKHTKMTQQDYGNKTGPKY